MRAKPRILVTRENFPEILEEPELHPGFLELDNVALTPHIGSASRATRLAMGTAAAGNLIAALAGERPPNLLNPDVWAHRRR